MKLVVNVIFPMIPIKSSELLGFFDSDNRPVFSRTQSFGNRICELFRNYHYLSSFLDPIIPSAVSSQTLSSVT
jgi:hypothetical protein